MKKGTKARRHEGTPGATAKHCVDARKVGAARVAPAASAPRPLTRRKTGRHLNDGGILLPYQRAWINDQAPMKLMEKSRRVGITWVESYDAVSTRFRGTQPRPINYTVTSHTEDQARLFIDYCRFWAKDLFGRIADTFTDEVEDQRTRRLGARHNLICPNGIYIRAISSNPHRIRGEGGDLFRDESAFHDEERAMEKASGPVIDWGGSVRCVSTHNGESTQFNSNVQRARRLLQALGHDPDRAPRDVAWETILRKAFELKLLPIYSYHRVTLEDALAQGLVGKINEKRAALGQGPLTDELFRMQCRAKCPDQAAYLEEYLCVAGTDKAAWLTHLMIELCEHDQCPQPGAELAGYAGGHCTVGVDVGRERDLTVIWVLEQVGDVHWTRQIVELKGLPLPEQQQRLEGVLHGIKWSSCVIDKTGIGLGLYEYTQRRVGGRVEGLNFTNQSKQALAVGIKQAFEERSVRIPPNNYTLRDDLHRVRKTTTPAGLVRFEGERTDEGHADRFWSLALALEGAKAGQAGLTSDDVALLSRVARGGDGETERRRDGRPIVNRQPSSVKRGGLLEVGAGLSGTRRAGQGVW